MFRSVRKDRNSKRSSMRRILVEQLENRKLMAFDVSSVGFEPSYWESDTSGFAWTVDSSAVKEITSKDTADVSEFAPISFELDTDNVPEDVMFGEAILSDATSDVSGFAWTVDSSAVKEITSKDSADVSEFSPISFELDRDNLPEDVMFGEAIHSDATSDVSGFAWAVDSSAVTEITSKDTADVSEFAPISFELDTDNLPEDVMFGEAILSDATSDVSGFAWTVDSSAVKEITSKDTADVSEFAPISFDLDTDNLPEDVMFGEAILSDATSDVSGFAWTVDSSAAKEITSKDTADVSEFAPISFDLDTDNVPEDVMFGEAILSDAKSDVSGFAWTVDSSAVTEITSKDTADVSEFAPISFELDTDNLPEDVMFGEAILSDSTSDVSGFAWAVDSSAVNEITSKDSADVSEFAPISFDLNADKLPDDVIFGETIPGVKGDMVAPSTDGMMGMFIGEAIVVDGADLAEVKEVPAELIAKSGSTDNSNEDVIFGEAIPGDKGDMVAPSTDGMMGMFIGEAIIVDGADLAEVKQVPAELIAKSATESNVTRKVKNGDRTLDKRDELAKAQSGTPKDVVSKVERKLPDMAKGWFGQSIQRKRTGESLRNQLIDSALIELMGS